MNIPSKIQSLSWLLMASLLIGVITFPVQVAGQGQDLPGTVLPNFQVVPVGSYVIPMDNVRQGNAAGTTFNTRAYGLANALLQANVPLRWAISTTKAKDGTDFTVNASKVAGVGGCTALTCNTGSQAFSGGPLIVFPGFEAQALTVITNFNTFIAGTANDVVVFQTTAVGVAPIRFNLTHKPKIAIGSVNDDIHMAVFDNALIPGPGGLGAPANVPATYASIVDTTITAGSCVTLVTQPHTGDPAAIDLIKAFTQDGGNFMAQCLATNTYENGPIFGQYQTNAGYVINNVNTVFTYPNANMPMSQFIGALNPETGGAEQDWNLAAGSGFINGTYANAQNSGAHTDKYASTTSKLYNAGLGGITTFLGGHKYDGTTIPEINGQRVLLNMVLQPATRPQTCPNLGFPLVEGYKSVRLGTQFGDDLPPFNFINPGDTIEWTITYVNTGSAATTGFQITDTIPSNTLFAGLPGSQVVAHNGLNGTTATANALYAGTGNMLNAGAVLGVSGQISVKLRTVIKANACTPSCQDVVNQANATGSTILPVNTDNIDNSTPGLPFTVPPSSVIQNQDPPIDPTVVPLVGPTAAPVSVEGRVIGTNGRGLSDIAVTLRDANTGESRSVITNSFGVFQFQDVQIGGLYILSAGSKKYSFPNGSVTFAPQDNVTDITIIGVPVGSGRTPAARPSVRIVEKRDKGTR